MPYENNFYKDIIDNLYDGVYFNRADQLMYLSKQSGRNRTTIG